MNVLVLVFLFIIDKKKGNLPIKELKLFKHENKDIKTNENDNERLENIKEHVKEEKIKKDDIYKKKIIEIAKKLYIIKGKAERWLLSKWIKKRIDFYVKEKYMKVFIDLLRNINKISKKEEKIK